MPSMNINTQLQANCNLLYLAFWDGFTETIKYHIPLILASQLDPNTKIQLLEAKNNKHFPGLYVASQNGHDQVVSTYITEVLNSTTLSPETKKQLLAAKNHEGTPGLYIALHKGQALIVQAYIKINLLGLAEKIMENLNDDFKKEIKNYLLQWVRDNIPDNNKQQIIRQYPLLTRILSIHRSTFFNHGQTSSMKALAKI